MHYPRVVALIVSVAMVPVPGWTDFSVVSLATAQADKALEEKMRELFDDDDGRPVRSVSIDVSGDGVPEKFVPNEFLCGNGGCPWLIYDAARDRVIGRIFASSIEVMERAVNGYHILQSYSSSGSAHKEWRNYEFSRGHYQEVAQGKR